MRPAAALFITVAAATSFTFSLGFGAGVLWGPGGPPPRTPAAPAAAPPATSRCEAERDQLRELYLSCSRGWAPPGADDPPRARPHTHADAGTEDDHPPPRPPEEEGCSH